MSERCYDTLSLLACSGVLGDIGYGYLPRFKQLRYLDVSRTGIGLDEMAVLVELPNLCHLDISSTSISWYQACQTISRLSNLTYLGLRCLELFYEPQDPQDLILKNYSQDGEIGWIADAFRQLPRLSRLDISGVRYASEIFAIARDRDFFGTVMKTVSRSTPCLTHLDAAPADYRTDYRYTLSDLAEDLTSTGMLKKLKYLGFMTREEYEEEDIPEVLVSCKNLQLAVRTRNYLVSPPKYQVQNAKRNPAYFMEILDIIEYVFSESSCEARADVVEPYCDLVLVALLCLRNYKSYKRLEKSLHRAMACEEFSPTSGRRMRKFWEKVMELYLEMRMNSSFTCSLVVRYAFLVADSPALLALSLKLIEETLGHCGFRGRPWFRVDVSMLRVVTELHEGCSCFESVLVRIAGAMVRYLSDIRRLKEMETLIIYHLPTFSLPESTEDQDGRVLYFAEYNEVAKEFTQMARRFPRVCAMLFETPSFIGQLAAVGGFAVSGCERYGEVLVGTYVEMCELMKTLMESPLFRPQAISTRLLEMILVAREDWVAQLPSSYLACLLLLYDESSWPNCTPTRDRVLSYVEDTVRVVKLQKAEPSRRFVDMRHDSFLSLLKMAQCHHTPQVALFAVYHLSLYCRAAEFGLDQYCAKCSLCLIKTEITFDVLMSLSIHSSVEAQMREVILEIVSSCESHEGEHFN